MSEQRKVGPHSTGDDAFIWAEKFCMKLRKIGHPANRRDWQVVLSHLIPSTDDVLRAMAEKGRTVGVSWLVPLVEGIREELQAGRAVRTADGAITLIAKPQASGLQVLL